MLELKNISLSVEDEFTNNAQKEILRDISLTVETGKLSSSLAQTAVANPPWPR